MDTPSTGPDQERPPVSRTKAIRDGLWDRIVSFDNLWQAARESRKGKRFRQSAAGFERCLGQNLTALRDQLLAGSYQPGPYTTFTIYEPAKRLISAAPYRDRVVHHALCRVIEPLFEPAFVFDSYANRKAQSAKGSAVRSTNSPGTLAAASVAREFFRSGQGTTRPFSRSGTLAAASVAREFFRRNRRGDPPIVQELSTAVPFCASLQNCKGTHAALDRATHYARRYPYVLQCDIRLFFPSLDHRILLQRLQRRIACFQTLGLCSTILNNSNPQEPAEFYFDGDDLFTPFERRRGLPIGNLTSQFWANVYMDPFDHYVKDDLGVKGYVRYVDDFLLFADSKAELHDLRELLDRRLAGEFRLLLHPRKTRIYPVSEGIPFLGFRVFPTHRRLLPASVKRARRRLGELSGDDPLLVRDRVRAWIAHARHGDTYGLRRHLLRALVLRPHNEPGS